MDVSTQVVTVGAFAFDIKALREVPIPSIMTEERDCSYNQSGLVFFPLVNRTAINTINPLLMVTPAVTTNRISISHTERKLFVFHFITRPVQSGQVSETGKDKMIRTIMATII